MRFWVNKRNSLYSSFKEHLGCRGQYGETQDSKAPHKDCNFLNVRTRTCAELIAEFGRPTYLKIDIEGMDMVCLNSLKDVKLEERPLYISMENVWPQCLDTLTDLGYDSFKVVDQLNVSWKRPIEAKGGSGPWGEDAVDYKHGMLWSTKEEVLRRINVMPRWKIWRELNMSIWYDVHGKRNTNSS